MHLCLEEQNDEFKEAQPVWLFPNLVRLDWGFNFQQEAERIGRRR